MWPPHLFSREHKSIVTTLVSELDTEGDGSDPLVGLGSIIAIEPVASANKQLSECGWGWGSFYAMVV